MPDKKPEKINSNTSSFLNTASQFLMGFSPNVASRAISANLGTAAKSKRRQEYDLNQTTTSAPEAPSAPSAPPPTTSSTPAISPKTPSPPQKREKQTAMPSFAQKVLPTVQKTDFKHIGATSTASGGNTDYSAGLGLMADTSGLKAEKSFTNPTSSRKEARQEKRATRLENRMAVQTAKGKAAAGDGRFIDANNKQGRVQNLQKRIDRLRK